TPNIPGTGQVRDIPVFLTPIWLWPAPVQLQPAFAQDTPGVSSRQGISAVEIQTASTARLLSQQHVQAARHGTLVQHGGAGGKRARQNRPGKRLTKGTPAGDTELVPPSRPPHRSAAMSRPRPRRCGLFLLSLLAVAASAPAASARPPY